MEKEASACENLSQKISSFLDSAGEGEPLHGMQALIENHRLYDEKPCDKTINTLEDLKSLNEDLCTKAKDIRDRLGAYEEISKKLEQISKEKEDQKRREEKLKEKQKKDQEDLEEKKREIISNFTRQQEERAEKLQSDRERIQKMRQDHDENMRQAREKLEKERAEADALLQTSRQGLFSSFFQNNRQESRTAHQPQNPELDEIRLRVQNIHRKATLRSFTGLEESSTTLQRSPTNQFSFGPILCVAAVTGIFALIFYYKKGDKIKRYFTGSKNDENRSERQRKPVIQKFDL